MKGAILILISNLLVLSTCYVVIEDKEDTSDLGDHGDHKDMLPFVHRPRFSTSVNPDKRAAEEEENLTDVYKKIREDTKREHKRTHTKTRYIVLREDELNDGNTEQLGQVRTRYRFAPNGKRAFRPRFGLDKDARPRFGLAGRKDEGPRFGISNDEGPRFGISNDEGPRFGISNDEGPRFGLPNDDRPRFFSNGKKDARPRFSSPNKKDTIPRFFSGDSFTKMNGKKSVKIVLLDKNNL